MTNCLTGLVGVTRLECECDDELPDGFNARTSDAGVWLEDVLNLGLTRSAECGDTSTWGKVIRLRDKSLGDFERAVTMELQKTHRPMVGWGGRIGSQGLSSESYSGNLFGVRVYGRGHRGAYLTIKGVSLKLTGTGQTPVFRILDKDGQDVVPAITGAAYAVSGQWQTYLFATPVKLPLWGDTDLSYTITHNQSAFINNKADCKPCGGGRLPYEDFIRTEGVHSANAGTSWNATMTQYGMTINADVSCGLDYALCDSASDITRAAAAVVIQHLWAINIIDDIVNDPEPSRWTALSPDSLKDTRDYLGGPLKENLALLVSSMRMGDCFKCSGGITRQTILK
jgi:hypothetical protein